MEVLGDNNKEEDAEVEATLVEVRVTLDNNDNADNTRLNITSCNVCNDECQTLKELEAHMNSHLVEVGPGEANSSSLCKRKFKCADDLKDHQVLPQDLRRVRQARSDACTAQMRAFGSNVLMQRSDFKCKLAG